MTDDVVEMALDGTGIAWMRRETGWALTPPGLARESNVVAEENEVRVEAVLIEWDEAREVSVEALRVFLTRAEAELTGVRCRLGGTRARIEAVVPEEQLESELEAAIRDVVGGCRALAREARALLDGELARHYLAFSGEPGA
jgi:hypothetical protein